MMGQQEYVMTFRLGIAWLVPGTTNRKYDG